MRRGCGFHTSSSWRLLTAGLTFSGAAEQAWLWKWLLQSWHPSDETSLEVSASDKMSYMLLRAGGCQSFARRSDGSQLQPPAYPKMLPYFLKSWWYRRELCHIPVWVSLGYFGSFWVVLCCRQHYICVRLPVAEQFARLAAASTISRHQFCVNTSFLLWMQISEKKNIWALLYITTHKNPGVTSIVCRIRTVIATTSSFHTVNWCLALHLRYSNFIATGASNNKLNMFPCDILQVECSECGRPWEVLAAGDASEPGLIVLQIWARSSAEHVSKPVLMQSCWHSIPALSAADPRGSIDLQVTRKHFSLLLSFIQLMLNNDNES